MADGELLKNHVSLFSLAQRALDEWREAETRAKAAEDAIERVLDLDNNCHGSCCLMGGDDRTADHDAAFAALQAVYEEIKKRKAATDG